MAKTIWDLELHEAIDFGKQDDGYILRVPDGWLYTTVYRGIGVASVFVPYSDDLKPKKKSFNPLDIPESPE